MGPLTLFAIYFMIWWVTLFAVLPFGNVSHHEADIETVKGGDPGAPLMTNLKKKLIINTVLAAIVFGVTLGVIHFNLIPLPTFPA
jgi:predicted secreted protein